MGGVANWIRNHETSVSTFEDASEAAVGFPGADVYQKRPDRDSATPSKGAAAIDRRLILCRPALVRD
jgi:hypothetical protein